LLTADTLAAFTVARPVLAAVVVVYARRARALRRFVHLYVQTKIAASKPRLLPKVDGALCFRSI
jgi:hypothetical protein